MKWLAILAGIGLLVVLAVGLVRALEAKWSQDEANRVHDALTRGMTIRGAVDRAGWECQDLTAICTDEKGNLVFTAATGHRANRGFFFADGSDESLAISAKDPRFAPCRTLEIAANGRAMLVEVVDGKVSVIHEMGTLDGRKRK